jgi:hypothetical protein
MLETKLHNNLIIEKEYSTVILGVSFLLGINSVYGLYNYIHHNMEYYDVLLTNTLLFMSSFNYWRKPTYGFRRKIDMILSAVNFIYNSYAISHCNYSWICYICMKFIVIFYALSWFYHNKNQKALGTFCHCLVHISANIAHAFIFSGIISAPLLYEISTEIEISIKPGISFNLNDHYNLLLCLITFIIYTIAYTSVIYNQNIAKMITPKSFKKSVMYSHELVAYFVSSIHSGFMAISGLFNLIDKNIVSDSFFESVFYSSMGYYLSDLLYLIITNTDIGYTIPFIIHHLTCIVMEIYTLILPIGIYKNIIRYYGTRFCLAEFSVIPLNYIWYLKNTDSNYKTNIKYKTAFEAVFRLFFVCRIINLTHLIYEICISDYRYDVMNIAGLSLTLLNYIWFYKIYKINKTIKKSFSKVD